MARAQLRQRFAQPRAAGEVVDGGAGGGQHLVGVGEAEGRRQVGQVGAEGEHVAPAGAPRRRMQEGEQQARIALHRARDVDQHQQRQRLLAPRQPRQPQQSRRRCAPASCSTPGQCMREWAPASPAARRRRAGSVGTGSAMSRARRSTSRYSAAPSALKSAWCSALPVAGRHGGVELDLALGLRGLGRRRAARRSASRTRGRRFDGSALPSALGSICASSLLASSGSRNQASKSSRNTSAVLLAADHHGLHRGAQVGRLSHADQRARPAAPARCARRRCARRRGAARGRSPAMLPASLPRRASPSCWTQRSRRASSSGLSRSRGQLVRERGHVVALLEQDAGGVDHDLGVELQRCRAPPAPAPIRRFRRCRARAGRRWRRAALRRRPTKAATCSRQHLAGLRHLRAHDGQFALALGVVEPVVEAAPLDRVVAVRACGCW